MFEMFKSAVGLVKSSPTKLILILVLILAIISAVGLLYNNHITEVKSSGYNQCLTDIEKSNKKAESKELKRLKDRIEEIKKQRNLFEKSESEANKIIEKKQTENKRLKNEIANFDKHSTYCAFEPDFQRLYNDTIGNAPTFK
jgi:peptidoglycan hydrolase CwlO-like protein